MSHKLGLLEKTQRNLVNLTFENSTTKSEQTFSQKTWDFMAESGKLSSQAKYYRVDLGRKFDIGMFLKQPKFTSVFDFCMKTEIAGRWCLFAYGDFLNIRTYS